MTKNNMEKSFVLCVENQDCQDLEKRKVYRTVPDRAAEKNGYRRVIDESGEDYLYPSSYFVPIKVPLKAREALHAAG